jgi:hypothetical protein
MSTIVRLSPSHALPVELLIFTIGESSPVASVVVSNFSHHVSSIIFFFYNSKSSLLCDLWLLMENAQNRRK